MQSCTSMHFQQETRSSNWTFKLDIIYLLPLPTASEIANLFLDLNYLNMLIPWTLLNELLKVFGDKIMYVKNRTKSLRDTEMLFDCSLTTKR